MSRAVVPVELLRVPPVVVVVLTVVRLVAQSLTTRDPRVRRRIALPLPIVLWHPLSILPRSETISVRLCRRLASFTRLVVNVVRVLVPVLNRL